MGKQFDELSKALASGVPRRTALRRFLAGAAGAMLATLIPGRASAQGVGKTSRDECVAAATAFFRTLGVEPTRPEFNRFVEECVRVAVVNQVRPLR